MSADAVMRAAEALAQRLRSALAAARQPGTVFIGPLDNDDARGAALILLLYRIAPNASQRNSVHRVARRNDEAPIDYDNALPLDLYFLLTVGNSAGSDDQMLHVLGVAIQALNASPILAGVEVAQDPVRVSMEPLSTEEISRIWALFPTVNYRTSVAYLATPVWVDPPAPPEPVRAVLQDAPRVRQRERIDRV